MTDSRFISVAAGGSVAVHIVGCALAIFLVAARGLFVTAPPTRETFTPPPPSEEEMTMITPDMIIVVEKSTPPPESEIETGHVAFVDARGMREASTPAPAARFEADRNTVAGSASDAHLDPVASPDLPSQPGANVPSIHVEEAAPLADRPVVGEGDFMVPDPDPSGPQTGEGAAEALKNAMSGSAPRREEVAVGAVETPRASYETAVVDALRASKDRVVGRLRLPVGSATVRFDVDRSGRKENPRFVGRPTDPRIGDAALSAVLDARLPEIPAELFEDLPDGRLPFTYQFISY